VLDYPFELQREVEEHLAGLRFGVEAGAERLEQAMRYSLLAGGKRIRPVLCLATAEALDHEPADVLPLAAAIEMIHTYSLIHDDLPAMDDDVLRRGKPTCHVAFGEDVAILAGDGLFAEALRIALTDQPGEPANVLAAARELTAAVAVDGMVGGQFLDVSGHAPASDASGAEGAEGAEGAANGESGEGAEVARDGVAATAALRRLHGLKTGRLIEASVGCAIHLCGASGPATIGLRRFAAELGIVFQIVDDILDVTGADAELGKPSGSDERHGKRTYVSVLGLDRARELAAESHGAARAALAEAGGETGALAGIADHVLTRQA
jgi:geranylgeranyl diphosphate synthase type II